MLWYLIIEYVVTFSDIHERCFLLLCAPDCVYIPQCSFTAQRSWWRLDQVEAQLTKFVQWVLVCQDRNSENPSSAAELNVFFSLPHFSWENQTEKWLLWMISCCVGFWVWEDAALVSSWHLREKNNFVMQMVSKNAEIQNYRYKNGHFLWSGRKKKKGLYLQGAPGSSSCEMTY